MLVIPTLMPPSRFPRPYTLFFLYIEPISALVGAYYAHFDPAKYLALTSFPSSSSLLSYSSPSIVTTTILSQLANLYLLFALNEALVLRSTNDLRVWRTLLFGLLMADAGHLWSVNGFGWSVYWRAWEWNEMMWGNLGFVYLGMAMRVCFLSGVGISGNGKSRRKAFEKAN